MLKKGDYVLATKWSDGEAWDHWFVGFLEKIEKDRYFMSGDHFNRGFRRAEKIPKEIGDYIIENKYILERDGTKLFDLVYKLKNDIVFHKANIGGMLDPEKI